MGFKVEVYRSGYEGGEELFFRVFKKEKKALRFMKKQEKKEGFVCFPCFSRKSIKGKLITRAVVHCHDCGKYDCSDPKEGCGEYDE